MSATTKNRGNLVEIRIRDNGSGIPPEVKEKIAVQVARHGSRRFQPHGRGGAVLYSRPELR